MSDTNEDSKQELIMSDEFENALISGAEIQNNDIPLCKSRNKNNYSSFYDLMLASNREIQSILDTKKKNRSNEDNEKVKQFKKSTSKTYKQVCKILSDLAPNNEEDVEDEQNEETPIEKMVHRITDIAKYLNYIGENALEDEFKKNGIELKFESLDKEEFFAQDHIKEQVTNVFQSGSKIVSDMKYNRERIKNEVFPETVPIELQYDKNTNPTGITGNDFCKMVAIKAKLLASKDNDDEQEKTKDKASKMVGDNVFQIQRNEIINRKVAELAS